MTIDNDGAKPALGRNQFGCDQRRPANADGYAERREHVRQRRRNHHAAENFEVARAERLRHPHVDRRQQFDAFVDHDHAGEKRRIDQHRHARRFANAEVNDHQRDQRNRWQRPEKIDDRIDEAAHRRIPAEQKGNRDRDHQSANHADQYPARGQQHVKPKLFFDGEVNKLAEHLLRRRQQTRINEANGPHCPPDADDDCERRRPVQEAQSIRPRALLRCAACHLSLPE